MVRWGKLGLKGQIYYKIGESELWGGFPKCEIRQSNYFVAYMKTNLITVTRGKLNMYYY